jgi:uncharacterized protein
MRPVELPLVEFDAVRAVVREAVCGEVDVEESEVPDGFPFPRTSVCAALAQDSVVVGADRRLYRCGLQVGETSRSVGALPVAELTGRSLPVIGSDSSDESFWREFDPTSQPNCSRCSFLPVCWSGCPKKHLENDQHAIAEQGAYWRFNLPRLVASGVGAQLSDGTAFGFADQFRDGQTYVERGA